MKFFFVSCQMFDLWKRCRYTLFLCNQASLQQSSSLYNLWQHSNSSKVPIKYCKRNSVIHYSSCTIYAICSTKNSEVSNWNSTLFNVFLVFFSVNFFMFFRMRSSKLCKMKVFSIYGKGYHQPCKFCQEKNYFSL